MTTFYRVHGAKLSYAEYWRMAPGPLTFAFVAGCKLLGCPMRFTFAIPRPDRLFVVEFEDLPGSARRAMKPAMRSAESAGLRLIFCHRLAVPEPNRLGVAALYLDDRNETAVMILHGRQGPQSELHVSCATRFADETLAITTTMKKSMEPAPWQDVERYPGFNTSELYGKHLEHLDRLAGQDLIPVPFVPNRLEEFVLECEVRYVDYHIDRGVFVPMTDEELDAISDTTNEDDESW